MELVVLKQLTLWLDGGFTEGTERGEGQRSQEWQVPPLITVGMSVELVRAKVDEMTQQEVKKVSITLTSASPFTMING